MRFLVLLFTFLIISAPAFAQDVSALSGRLERLERDITFLQRQVYKGGAAADPNAEIPASGSGTAGLQVQIAQIQEQMRALQGQIEQISFKNQQNADEMKRLAEDVDFRLQRLEQAGAPVAATDGTDPEATPSATPAAPAPAATEGFDVNGDGTAKPAASYQPEAAAPAAKGFATSKDHYNAAFKLLNESKHADAATQFSSFIKKYPKDALVPNAYYWMGESFYARKNYASAAEGFRKGYETAPKGQKAPDNLLKLSMSLANLKRMDEACIVLKQVSVQYATSAKTTAAKAVAERKRLNCA